jgi:hypothetical protein
MVLDLSSLKDALSQLEKGILEYKGTSAKRPH